MYITPPPLKRVAKYFVFGCRRPGTLQKYEDCRGASIGVERGSYKLVVPICGFLKLAIVI